MYEVGDAVELAWRVLDSSRKRADATVTLTVVPPVGAAVVVTPDHPGIGEYRASFVPTTAGRHVIRWRATGALSAAKTDVVNVASASAPVAIISLDQLRQHLNISDDQHGDDEELRQFLDAASLVVEEYTGQVIARRTVVEDVFVANGSAFLRPPVQEVVSVISLDGLTEYAAPALVDGFIGTASGLSAVGWVRVTYVAGMSEVPEHYQTATAIIAAHLWTTQRPSTANAPGLGGFDSSPAPSGRGYLIPNQAAQLLGGRAANRP